MPELPEVETIARGLQHELPGSTFAAVTVEWSPMVRKSPLDLVERLPGQRVEQVRRRGKYLVFALESGDALLIHLKMSGRLYVCTGSDEPNPYDRISFHLCDGRQMRFRDPRKFGRAYLTADAASMLSHLGPEPLDDAFGEGDFLARFDGRRGLIKPLLVDQTFVAGVGNIYADEALFLARVRPDRRVVTLAETDRRALFIGLRSVLKRGIELNGATLADGVFHGGSFQSSFCVYSRACEPCPTCGTPIERIRLGQRSAHYCPSCQV
jgi:formamidopyrimidine-DNA glycosylase